MLLKRIDFFKEILHYLFKYLKKFGCLLCLYFVLLYLISLDCKVGQNTFWEYAALKHIYFICLVLDLLWV